jgi:hypothetical protein
MFALRSPLPLVSPTYRKRPIPKVCKSYYTIDKNNSKPLDEVKTHDLLHILTFHRPDVEQGVYSIRKLNHGGLPEDNILAFTNFEDALRFKTLLDAEMNISPYVQFASRFELNHACTVGGYKCRVVNEGALVTPPTKTLSVTDWEAREALINGNWSVREKKAK